MLLRRFARVRVCHCRHDVRLIPVDSRCPGIPSFVVRFRPGGPCALVGDGQFTFGDGLFRCPQGGAEVKLLSIVLGVDVLDRLAPLGVLLLDTLGLHRRNHIGSVKGLDISPGGLLCVVGRSAHRGLVGVPRLPIFLKSGLQGGCKVPAFLAGIAPIRGARFR